MVYLCCTINTNIRCIETCFLSVQLINNNTRCIAVHVMADVGVNIISTMVD